MSSIFNLQNLIGNCPVKEFQDQYWTKKPFVGAIKSNSILEGLRYSSVEELIDDACASRTQLWFKTRFGIGETTVPIKDALACYGAGMTLFFNRYDEVVGSWFAQLEKDLGIPARDPSLPAAVASVFASPMGHGSAIHFDRFEIFTLQLIGEKNWWIGEPAFTDSTANHTPGDEYSRDFDAYRFDAISAPTREGMRKITLKPGDVLYVPRGYWHETEAHQQSDCASLNFAFSPPTRSDILIPLIRKIGERNPMWRKWANLQYPEQEVKIHNQLLAELGAQLLDLSRSKEREPASVENYRRSKTVLLSMNDKSLQGQESAILTDRFGKSERIELSQSIIEVARFFFKNDQAVNLESIARNLDNVSHGELRDALMFLIGIGYVIKC